MARDLADAARACVLACELADARRIITALAAQDHCLRCALRRQLPDLPFPGPPPPGRRAQHLAERMIEHIHENYTRPLVLTDVARALGRNVSYLSDLFVRTTGIAFHAYLDQLRLARACELLSDPTRTVADVAAATGYASDDWFRHAFKAHTGLSPTAWRSSRDPSGSHGPLPGRTPTSDNTPTVDSSPT